MKTFKVSISDIKDKIGDEKEISAASDLGKTTFMGNEINIGKTNITGVARNVGKSIELAASVDSNLVLECGRCLESFQHPMKLKLKELFYFDNEESEYNVEDDSIDVERTIIESIALNLDIKTLCKIDCKGVCPNCGINLNKASCECQKRDIDIRFNKLQKLKTRLQKSDKKNQKNSKE
ncbi:MAG: DUF177 domain-containing protein [Actinobacteria bacterium]|nr:MAG: DUF177 domain-containing protein [Actinomycetota bacterium]